MIRSVASRFALGMTAGAAALLASFSSLAPLRAADHLEAPLVAQDMGADIADVYLFLDPTNNQFAVMAMTTHSFITPSENANIGFFDSTLRYRFAIENTGDQTFDKFIDVVHTKQTSRTAPQTATISILNAKQRVEHSFTAPTTISRAAFGQTPADPTITTDPTTNISFFGGLVDDPFFFDLGAELAYRATRIASTNPPSDINASLLTRGRDSFAGTNTLVTAIRVPITSLLGTHGTKFGLTAFVQRAGSFKLNAKDSNKDKASGKFVTLDRMATPAVNTVFTSYANKDSYNRSTPEDDAAGKFQADIVENLIKLKTDETSIGILAGIAVSNGDILRLDTAIPNSGDEGGKNPEASFPNGRRPNDDVIDIIVTLVNNRVPQGDAVDDNELPFRNAFPFFAPPHMPFPQGADDLTRN